MSVGFPTDRCRDYGMHLAFRRYRSSDSLDRTERLMASCLGHKYSTVFVVIRVPCSGSENCRYCRFSCDQVSRGSTSHDLSFGVVEDSGVVMYVDKLYNRASAAHRDKGGDNRWTFVRIPLEECGSSEAVARKVLLPFFRAQIGGGAQYDKFGARWGYLARTTLALGCWRAPHLCFFVTHTAPAMSTEDIESQLGPLDSDSSANMKPRNWYCSELALTCLHMLGIATDCYAQLSSPTSLFKLCVSYRWKVRVSLPGRQILTSKQSVLMSSGKSRGSKKLRVRVESPRPDRYHHRSSRRRPPQIPTRFIEAGLT